METHGTALIGRHLVGQTLMSRALPEDVVIASEPGDNRADTMRPRLPSASDGVRRLMTLTVK